MDGRWTSVLLKSGVQYQKLGKAGNSDEPRELDIRDMLLYGCQNMRAWHFWSRMLLEDNEVCVEVEVVTDMIGGCQISR